MAQVRAAADRLRVAVRGPAGIDACRSACRDVPRRAPPVVAPLPDVAAHVEEPESVRLERSDRGRREITVVAGVDVREASLPDVAAMAAIRFQRISPWIGCAVQAAARGALPFGFG